LEKIEPNRKHNHSGWKVVPMTAIHELISCGIGKEEIAQKYGISITELESFLRLYYENSAGRNTNEKGSSKQDYQL